MNASKRMKYASTPTYGMQKRGPQKKTSAPPQPSTPDFTQFAFPQAPSVPPIPSAIQTDSMLFGSGGFTGAMGSFPSPSFNTIPPGIQPGSSIPLASQQPFGGASFLQSTPASLPMQGQPLAPLGNAPLVSPSTPNAFSPRQQGYVPPPASALGASGSMPPPLGGQPSGFLSLGQPASTPPIQPVNPTPAGNFLPNGFPPVMTGQYSPPLNQGMNTSPMASSLGMQQPLGMQPIMPPLQQGVFTPPVPPKAPHQTIDWDKVLLFYLFGILPMLFIPCMFVAPAMDFLRYSFIVLCVVGLVAMWYRQMFTPSTRTTLSIVYAALCIVIVSMLLSASTDAQQTNARSNLGANVQTSAGPNQMGGVFAASDTQVPASVTPAPPVALGESEAEKRLITFMDYWSINRTEDMVSLVQPSWATSKENPAAELFNVLVNRTPEEYTIESISGSETDTSRTVTMSAYINKNNGKDPVRYRFMIMMVKEGSEWYVDPNSLATNDVVIESTDGSGAASLELATPAPITTVTPVPPENTKLYYNPNGGSFYHADPNCPSVKEQYLPLAGSFLYKDLAEYRSLQPAEM